MTLHPTFGLCLCALLLTGCNLFVRPTPTRAVDAATPEGVALRYAAATAPNAEAAAASFGVIHTWTIGADRLIAYSFSGGYEDAWSVCNGLARLAPEADGWRVTEAGQHCWDDAEAVHAITGLYSTITGDDGDTHTVIYGDVRNPDVTAVSIEFVVGGANTVAEIDDGGYWLMQPGAGAPARAIAINEAGNLVQMRDFGAPLTLAPVGVLAPNTP